MAPLFHPIAAHFAHLPSPRSETVDIPLDISLADCLASLASVDNRMDEDDALDSLLADLELLH
ncbi:MAG: hypothetical protein EOP40_00400 [Rubrivivax sp.]|nr:MAG: hypothetical protein EOP40_00400 [Rubrivivax sp.]